MKQGNEIAIKIEPLKKTKLIYCLAALVAFITGTAIYMFFRNTGNLVLFQYFSRPSFLDSMFVPVRTNTFLSRLFVFNLNHGLWCLSGLLVIRAIWLENIKWRAIYAGIFLVIISALEISQIHENRNGTFDVLDLASYGFFAFVESMI